jgi:hypothetical protein
MSRARLLHRADCCYGNCPLDAPAIADQETSMKKSAAFAVVVAAFVPFCGRATAEPIIIGRPSETANCFPFGCAGQFGPSTRYQQIYS